MLQVNVNNHNVINVLQTTMPRLYFWSSQQLKFRLTIELVQLSNWFNYRNGSAIEMVQLSNWFNYRNGSIIELVQISNWYNYRIGSTLELVQLSNWYNYRSGSTIELGQLSNWLNYRISENAKQIIPINVRTHLHEYTFCFSFFCVWCLNYERYLHIIIQYKLIV